MGIPVSKNRVFILKLNQMFPSRKNCIVTADSFAKLKNNLNGHTSHDYLIFIMGTHMPEQVHLCVENCHLTGASTFWKLKNILEN